MANLNCKACDDLRNEVPQLIANGFDSNMCASLQNDTGLSPSSGHDDCTDLNKLNDCLVGNMEEELEAYDVCDWKTFMKKLIPNLWTTIKGIICAICGLWKLAKRIDCVVDYVTQGASFSFGEYTSSGNSYIVAGKGISFANVSASGTASDVQITYVAGGTSVLSGSCLFYNADFTDRTAVANYDDSGVNPTTSANRKGNPKWNAGGYMETGGELIYELRIKKSEYPQIARFWSSHAFPGAGGNYSCHVWFINEGRYASGQTGWVDSITGEPQGSHSSPGHLVPSGWMYLQLRMISADSNFPVANTGTQYSPHGIVPIRMRTSAIDC